MSGPAHSALPRSLEGGLAFDLEHHPKKRRILAFAAVLRKPGGLGDSSFCWRPGQGSLREAADRLDGMARKAQWLLGHNIVEHDLPILQARFPGLALLGLPVVDTLRLGPLAFPSYPYHALVKHYRHADVRRTRRNDPELDARLSSRVFDEQRQALAEASRPLLEAWHWLCTPDPQGRDRALDALFRDLRGSARPQQAGDAIRQCLEGRACATQIPEVLSEAGQERWPLAYALSWLSVADGDAKEGFSSMPPWVVHKFPQACRLVRQLRDKPCRKPGCSWCRERHDALKELRRWLGFAGFRKEPSASDGKSMQQAIVEHSMAGRHVLGILPTGTGKSICYQVPALSRYSKTGALTVVLSPLVALMADQVEGMERNGVDCCVALNGLLTPLERGEVLERIRMGHAGILLTSPEQLRSLSLCQALDQREIGGWVLDEAHCLSSWGHDFRPDYRYISRFVRQQARGQEIPPVMCLTATARPQVVKDIKKHFRDRLKIALLDLNGGTQRPNLSFEVIPCRSREKYGLIHGMIGGSLPGRAPGGAIVYCATRRQSEDVAGFLRDKGMEAGHFHGGLQPGAKKQVQQSFISGKLQVIAATNAFGMGVDKPDVRLVIHADIPGSLENYLQEAGRAGRDRQPARCLLLYDKEDVERQFRLSARSRLDKAEIQDVLRVLCRLDDRARKAKKEEVVATAGEILSEETEDVFRRDPATDDTRVKTAVSWLEEAGLVERTQNRVRIFPSSVRIRTLEEAGRKLVEAGFTGSYLRKLRLIVRELLEARADSGISTDRLMEIAGLSPREVRSALHKLDRLGLVYDEREISAYVHTGGGRLSRDRYQEARALEEALVEELRRQAPGAQAGEGWILHLRHASQELRNRGLPDPLPERLWRLLCSIRSDGQDLDPEVKGTLALRKRDRESVRVKLLRPWDQLDRISRLRRDGAGCLLERLLGRLDPKARPSSDLMARSTMGELLQAIESDLALRDRARKPDVLMEKALLWLHDQEAIRLHRSLTVFRPAMTLKLNRKRRRTFTQADYRLLENHYRRQVGQIHFMEEYARKGLESMRLAERLAKDYFRLKDEAFLKRWLKGRESEIGLQATPESWQAIVEDLGSPQQKRIVADGRKETHVLVLAGPGSGKTRVLVHRIAFLIRIQREDSRGILALAYNRHAACEIRSRLRALIGDDARGVTILTCHALAMRLTGTSFTGSVQDPGSNAFRQALKDAARLLQGEDLPIEDSGQHRESLLSSFRWILVDEYQDIGAEEYALVSGMAGRTLGDDARKLALFAVGDDDQNIYSFKGASVEFIRRFEQDYRSRPAYLVDNYRSSGHIVNAANMVISQASERMKADHPIRADPKRREEPGGGDWALLDPVAEGRVQILPPSQHPVAQACSVVDEMKRLSSLSPSWDWSRCAVIAREWSYLDPVLGYCQQLPIPARMANRGETGLWPLRETQRLVEQVRSRPSRLVDASVLRRWTAANRKGPWNEMLGEAVEEYALECGQGDNGADAFLEWLAEWCREARRKQRELLLLTAHRAKGLEFDHVAVLDGGWESRRSGEDPDAPRRLYYVAMTRARQTLVLARLGPNRHPFHQGLEDHASVAWPERAAPLEAPMAAYRKSLDLSPREVNLGHAGRFAPGHPVHRAIAGLSPGDPLEVVRERQGPWTLLDASGQQVGKLAKGFQPPDGSLAGASVFAVLARSLDQTPVEYREGMRCRRWEAVLPTLEFDVRSPLR